jgi:hypothetical protein
MLSMSSGGDQDYYAISFITYSAINSRQAFFDLAEALSKGMDKLFAARCHWGKHWRRKGDAKKRGRGSFFVIVWLQWPVGV